MLTAYTTVLGGFQWRGYAAYICGILVNVVGFAGAVGSRVPSGATYIYQFSFFAGFLVSATVYYLLCNAFPLPGLSPTEGWFEPELIVSGSEAGIEEDNVIESGTATSGKVS